MRLLAVVLIAAAHLCGCTWRVSVAGLSAPYAGQRISSGQVALVPFRDERGDAGVIGVGRNGYGAEVVRVEAQESVAAAFTDLVARQLREAGFDVEVLEPGLQGPPGATVIRGVLAHGRVDGVGGFTYTHHGAVVARVLLDARGGRMERTFVGLSTHPALGPDEGLFERAFREAAADAANQIASALAQLHARDYAPEANR